MSKVQKAEEQWRNAPMHVKAIAGAYMVPVLEALHDLQRQIDQMAEWAITRSKHESK